jgi:hypothetical protein
MKNKLMMTAAILMILLPMSALALDRAIAVVVEDGGIGEPSARTARGILIDELRNQGVDVGDAPALDRIHPLDDGVKQAAAHLSAGRVYVLKLSALGQKIIVKIEERTANLEEVSSRRLPAAGPEELDVIIPRVVEALVKNLPVEQTARMDSVSVQEGRKWEKLPGEFLWGVGIILGGGLAEGAVFSYGLDLKVCYEMEHFRLNFEMGGLLNVDEDDGFFRTGVGASYIPMTTFWSPYFGVSIDYMAIMVDDWHEGGAGAVVHAGVEFFRLHSARMLVEMNLFVPFFEIEDSSNVANSRYAMVLTGNVTVMW